MSDLEIERESDFATAVQERGIIEWLRDEAPAEPETPAEDQQPRDDKGRFAAKEETPEVTEASTESEAPAEGDEADTEVPSEETQTVEDELGDLVLEVDDPALVELFEGKYKGDLVEVLKALKESQGLIGRQGQELGELRPLQDQIEALRQQIEEQQRLSIFSMPYASDIEDNPRGLVMEIAQRFVESQGAFFDQPTFDRALQAWAEEEPYEALAFRSDFLPAVQFAAHQMAAELEQPAAPSFSDEMETLKAKHPDLPESLPAIKKLAEERPALARLLQDEDPRTRVAALEDLYLLAQSQSREADTSQRARQIILRAKAEADTAKEEATVVSATQTPQDTPEPSGVDQFRSWFLEATGQSPED